MTTEYEFDPFPPRPEPRLWSLYMYWRDRGKGGLPAWTAIDHPDLARWRRHLMLIRFEGDVADYEIEWEGAGLQQYYGAPRTGHGVETLTASRERELLMKQYGAVLATRRPAYFDAAFTNSDGVFARQCKVILPFSSDGQRIDRVLAGIYFHGMSNVVEIVGRLNDMADSLRGPKDSSASIAQRQWAITAKRDQLCAQLHHAEKRAGDMGYTRLAAKLRTTLFIVTDMLVLEAKMVEAGAAWPWRETTDDLLSLFDFGLGDVIRADIAEIGDAVLLGETLGALDAYRDALLSVA